MVLSQMIVRSTPFVFMLTWSTLALTATSASAISSTVGHVIAVQQNLKAAATSPNGGITGSPPTRRPKAEDEGRPSLGSGSGGGASGG